MGKAKTDKADGRVALPADCRIADLAAVKAALEAALSAPATELDGAAVERVDTAALQLLAVFRREAAARGMAVRWAGASDVLRDGAARLGLAQTLELPAAMPA
ncbi:STAS domain-containing protein [Dyella marensis]|uniref:STAS domain-containing protein n=1 Tax=Dyella marensis TaxID=500610 RepID=UPI0031E120E7